MMKIVSIVILIIFTFNLPISAVAQVSENNNRQANDAVIWEMATNFTSLFNSRDTALMRKFLPQGFMLQWMHDNCMGRKAVLQTMSDTAVHARFRHLLHADGQVIINYSDDGHAASLNAGLVFLDNRMLQLMKNEKAYGLCIMYFEMTNDNHWSLRTVHLDMHCNLCNLQ